MRTISPLLSPIPTLPLQGRVITGVITDPDAIAIEVHPNPSNRTRRWRDFSPHEVHPKGGEGQGSFRARRQRCGIDFLKVFMKYKSTVLQTVKRSLVLIFCLALVACQRQERALPANEKLATPIDTGAPQFSSKLPLTLIEGVVLQKLTIIDQKGSATLLRGEAQNTSNKAIPWLDVRFKLLDKDGKALGSATAIVENLHANGHWGFEATLPEQGVVSAVVEHVGSRALR